MCVLLHTYSVPTKSNPKSEPLADVQRWLQQQSANLWPAALGSLSFRRSPCIRPNCPACLSGEKHPSYVLYGRQQGRRFSLYVPEELVPQVQRWLDNGRALQELRLRCCQGRRASLLSQRQSVAPLISATRPWVITCWRISAIEIRDKGIPRRCGNSQASTFTWTTRLGGKVGLAPASRFVLKTWQAGQAKPFTPFTNDLARRIEPSSSHIIGQSFRCEEDNSGANDITIR